MDELRISIEILANILPQSQYARMDYVLECMLYSEDFCAQHFMEVYKVLVVIKVDQYIRLKRSKSGENCLIHRKNLSETVHKRIEGCELEVT